MQDVSVRISKPTRKRQRQPERGVALLTTLLLLLLMTGLSLAMVISVRSDLLVNGYYRNFRGSFYAADSGLNIVRADMINKIGAAIPASVAINTAPIPNGTEGNVKTAINTTYGSTFTITGSGSVANSWPASFALDPNQTQLALVSCTPQGTNTGTCAAPANNPPGYVYIYSYSLSSIGQTRGGEKATVSDSGNFTLVVSTSPGATTSTSTTTTSFAAWGMFIDQQNICSGSILVPGTISGPVFTNGSWTFGDTGGYNFTDSVGSAGANGGYQFSNGTCDQVNGATDTNGGTTITPKFNQGYNRGQPKVPLPPNAFSQERAVLDGKGTNNSQVQNSDLNAVLKNINQTAYPTNGTSSGVYLPYTTTVTDPVTGKPKTVPPTLTGGGIFVQGDAQVTLSPTGANGQVYTIVNNGVTTTITIIPGSTPGSGTTTVQSGNTSLSIIGVPAVQDSSSNPTADGTMLYVNGNITGLKGPGEGQAAINDGTALTITATNNVTITGDIRYKTEPVTLTASGNTPADSLVAGSDHGQVLGIFTASGDIQLNNGQSDQTLQIDGSLATISQGGSGGLTNTGSAIKTLNIVGGRIQNNIKGINTTTRNVFFDRRFANGFAPPWFPSTTVTTTTTNTVAQDNTSMNPATFVRTQWLYKSGLQ
jgi:Tfp pilus assembly protein PilX